MASIKITEATRRDISDLILIENIAWSGRLDEPEFLSRLYNLKEMPSTDSRFDDAYGDIWQHQVNNYDWDADWVFTDYRFDLMHAPDDVFLRFLCETLHPVVRTSQEEIEKLKQAYNLLLANDGYEIVPKTKIGNRELYAARQIALSAELHIASLKKEFIAACVILGDFPTHSNLIGPRL